jgi:hypothetical protein
MANARNNTALKLSVNDLLLKRDKRHLLIGDLAAEYKAATEMSQEYF